MGKLILTITLGGFIIYMGILIAFKGRLDLIHNYHHRYVDEKNKTIFCHLVGGAMITSGLGFAGLGVLSNLMGKEGYFIALGILFLGIVIAVVTILKYNTVNQYKEYSEKKKR